VANGSKDALLTFRVLRVEEVRTPRLALPDIRETAPKGGAMWKRIVISLLILLLPAATAHAEEFRIGLGIFNFAGGPDFQVNYRPNNSHWQLGYRHNRWIESFEDPFSGMDLSENTTTMTGPIVCYLLNIESSKTYYLGASLLRWSSTEESLRTGESDTESVVAPFFGGGYTRRLGKSGYFNLGAFISGAELKTETNVSGTETTGLDLQLQMGIVF
jgi:hypothetical protein